MKKHSTGDDFEAAADDAARSWRGGSTEKERKGGAIVFPIVGSGGEVAAKLLDF